MKRGACASGIRVSSHSVSRFATIRPIEPERMDADDVPQDEIDTSFRFIRLVNRWLGGSSACLRAMVADRSAWPKDRPVRWLDLGTGAADIPLAIDRWSVRHGVSIECVAVDRHPACLRVAREAVGAHPRITVEEGDALALESRFGGGPGCEPFDYVHAGMFLHHLRDEDVVRVLRSMSRLARRLVIWNDLLRSRWSKVAIRIATVGQPAIVRDDATLSVEKGFSPSDAKEAARWAGLEQVSLRLRPLLGRFVLTGMRG
jgi:Methyltransferase domain